MAGDGPLHEPGPGNIRAGLIASSPMGMSHGSILVADGATPQSLTTTPAKLTCFAADGDHASNEDGDLAIAPDYANDRLKLKPGSYLVNFSLNGQPNDDIDVTFNLRLNGAVIVPPLGSKVAVEVDEGDMKASIQAVIRVREADLDVSLGYAVLEVYATGSGSGSITPTFAQLTAVALN